MNVALNKAFVLLSALTAAAIPGWAVLGGSAESVVTDQVKLQASRMVVEKMEYAVHPMTSADGTLIREYVTPAGNVFGVSWSGPPSLTYPNCSDLITPNIKLVCIRNPATEEQRW